MPESDSVYRNIGQRIRRAREAAGLSQLELARKLDFTSAASISHFEAGERKVRISDLQRVASLFGLGLDYFFQHEATTEADALSFSFRAKELPPDSRRAVSSFVSFARKHAPDTSSHPPRLSSVRPGAAAAKVLEAAGFNEPPVSPREVASRLGVSVYDWEFPDELSGIAVSDGGKAYIGVNESHPRVRQRFTVAHEIGHLVFDGEDMHCDFVFAELAALPNTEQEIKRERKANQFAADLLMPAQWLRQDVRGDERDLILLAKRYEVSEQALWFQLRSLKLV